MKIQSRDWDSRECKWESVCPHELKQEKRKRKMKHFEESDVFWHFNLNGGILGNQFELFIVLHFRI